MSAATETIEFPAPAIRHETPSSRGARLARPAGLALVLAVSAVLNTDSLQKNAYANTFYAAAVSSMLRSLHNFLFASFDVGGLESVDKTPLALWLQTASAKLFGFGPLSLILPQALIGVAIVAAVYLVTSRYLGPAAALAAGLATAVFPSLVAVSRENGVDPLLIALMTLAAGAGLAATRSGRWRSLIACAVLVGLAFNTKALAAYLVVPPIAVAYAVCAPGSGRRRAARLAVAGAVMLAVSFAWIAMVELTPASQRPYVGSSKDNSEVELALGYNGVGRVDGQFGGPDSGSGRAVSQGAARHVERHAPLARWAHAHGYETTYQLHEAVLPDGRGTSVIPFGGPPGPARLFGKGLADQAAWTLPLALFGLVALGALIALTRRERRWRLRMPSRRDPRLAFMLVFGGWLVVEFLVLSEAGGIVHPYYASALAPGVGAMAGAGIVACERLLRGRRRAAGVVLAVLAIGTTALLQGHLMQHYLFMAGVAPVLVGVAAVLCALIAAARRLAAPALASAFALLMIVPAAYAGTTWEAPVQGTFPAAGPRSAPGFTPYGVQRGPQRTLEAVGFYVRSHGATHRWEVLTDSSLPASTLILMGYRAGALAGYSGTDPAVSARQFADLVRRHQARYVLLGGAYWNRGGNSATRSVLRDCLELSPAVWGAPYPDTYGLMLFDCRGDARAIERDPG
ncbi:MAG TPA: glycosyltransferase family 39 protein [Solirubrobacteraceae bacterium]|nr:glycosyltransferase family 39 protein [Solirubrobacteraceae bacterium]